MEFLYIAFSKETAGDPRLVRNNKGQMAGVVDCFYRLARAFDPDQIGRPGQVTGVLLVHSVSIEKNG